MRLLFLSLFLCCHLFSDIAIVSAPAQVQVGEPFIVELNVDLPSQARQAFLLYCKLLIASRPLPFPFFLERVDLQENKAVLSARLLSEGTYKIPLGTFYWNGKSFPLPLIPLRVVPMGLSQPTLENYMSPFPESLVVSTSKNKALQEEQLKKQRFKIQRQMTWRYLFRLLIGAGALFSLFLPFFFQYDRWRKICAPPPAPAVLTPQERLRKIKTDLKNNEISWTPLLCLLNQFSEEKSSLTAHELKGRFSQKGDETLSVASSLIEQYAYRPKGDVKEFERAVHLIEGKLKPKLPPTSLLRPK